MTADEVQQLTARLLAGKLSQDEFVRGLLRGASHDLHEVTLDADRRRRCGFPEVVYGEGKTVATMTKIFSKLLADEQPVLATRVSQVPADELLQEFPSARYNNVARTFRIDVEQVSRPVRTSQETCSTVAVITAGTSDLPVAEEARETLDWMGVHVTMIHDVGVAGPHRLPAHLEKLENCDAVVVVAGLEGALPSVVGGYVAVPVIAVPTSVGYGASFGGVAALLGMLNSCASNVTVVNIDAGFKGGYIAGLIAKNRHQKE